ncbi:hypothetical protein [Flavobacterium phage FPSV-F12]|nr:hypothetical protein [Flavobacterium phage FPSV-F12]
MVLLHTFPILAADCPLLEFPAIHPILEGLRISILPLVMPSFLFISHVFFILNTSKSINTNCSYFCI